MNKAVACASRKGKYTPTIPLGGGAERLLDVLSPHQNKKAKKGDDPWDVPSKYKRKSWSS